MAASNEHSHLHAVARDKAALGNEQRIRTLQTDRWIDYPRATEALRRLQRLLETPQHNSPRPTANPPSRPMRQVCEGHEGLASRS